MNNRKDSSSTPAYGNRWNVHRDVLTIRAPLAIELDFRSLTLTSGDLSRIFLFALARVDPDSLVYVNTMSKKRQDVSARPKMGKALLLKVGVLVRRRLNQIAKEYKVPVNCVAIGILSGFLTLLQNEPGVKKELMKELRRRRGL